MLAFAVEFVWIPTGQREINEHHEANCSSYVSPGRGGEGVKTVSSDARLGKVSLKFNVFKA